MLLAYAKLALHDELLDEPRCRTIPISARELERYFPARMRERFPDAIATHRLRREIIATQLANAIVNRGGPTIVTRLVDQTGRRRADRRRRLRGDARFASASPISTPPSTPSTASCRARSQLRLYGDLQDLLMSRIVWFIRNVDLSGRLARRGGRPLPRRRRRGRARPRRKTLSPAARDGLATRSTRTLAAQGVPADLAPRLAALPDLVAAPDIVLVAADAPAARSPRSRATHFAVEGLFRPRRARRRGPRDRGQRLLRPPRPRPRHRRRRHRPPQPDRRGGERGGAGGSEAVEAWSASARRRREPHPHRRRRHRAPPG